MSTRLSDSELRDWYAFIRAHHQIVGRLSSELEHEHGMSLQYYEVLLTLSRAPDRHLRMSDLADAVMLSPSGLTRLIDRMVRDGLVERQPCPGDARAIFAALTDRGLRKFKDAALTHVRGIREHFVDRLPPSQRTHLRKSLEALTKGD